MKIEDYSFGRIVIGGKTYTSDVIIYPDRVDPSWWRKEGHRLYIDDLKEVLKAKPDVLVVGTGASGAMVVPKETEEYLKQKGIEVIIERTKIACEAFNKHSGFSNVIAALHLTC